MVRHTTQIVKNSLSQAMHIVIRCMYSMKICRKECIYSNLCVVPYFSMHVMLHCNLLETACAQ